VIWIVLLTFLCYGYVALSFALSGYRGQMPPARPMTTVMLVGFILHSIWLWGTIISPGPALNLNLPESINLFSWLLAGIYLSGIGFRSLYPVGVLITPALFCALLLVPWLSPIHPVIESISDPVLIAHLLLSLVGYGALTVAAGTAILYGLQDRALHQKTFSGLPIALPPLTVLEELLFHAVTVSWFLSLGSILSGMAFAYQSQGLLLIFNHKAVFALLTFLTLSGLILGRWRSGWRGRKAAGWLLTAYIFLAVAYFGVKVVTQVLLGR